MSNHLPPDAKRVLILAPHPDDETLGCGGTISLYTSKGVEVHLVVISDGKGISHEFSGKDIDIVALRKREAVDASKILGIHRTHFLNFPDGELKSYQNEMKERIEYIVRGFNPDIIFAPSPVDHHNDHIAVSELALWLLQKVHGIKIAFYEVYETVRFNALVDISDVMHVKEKAILTYHYSLFQRPDVFADAIRGLNMFRALYTRDKRYYEAFYIVSESSGKAETLTWLTYGMKEDPAVVFLSKIKVVDELLFEFKKCNELLQSREAEIQKLQTVIQNRELNIDALQARLADVTSSLIWKMATRFYRMRDRLLPEDSILRGVYDKISGKIKTSLK